MTITPIVGSDAANETDCDLTLDQVSVDFGIRRDAPIDTALKRLHSWALAAIAGSINVVRVDDVLYSWDPRPRRLKNGALQGRVYAQGRGELTRDLGGFKIDADGRVVHIPRELAGVLPGTENAIPEEQQP